MVAVREEARIVAERHAAEAAAANTAVLAEAAESPEPERAVPIVSLAPPALRTSRRLPRPLNMAAIAAVLLVALVGVGGVIVFGVRQMAPRSVATSSTYMLAPNTGAAPTAESAPYGSNAGGSAAPAGKADSAASAAATATGPKFITVAGAVFSLSGPAAIDVSALSPIGSTASALGQSTSVASRKVYAGPTAQTVYVPDDAGKAYAFTRVTRSYLGFTYALAAPELSDYGRWPTLPSTVPAPTSADGQPTFLYDSTDASGVKIYRLTTAPATEGIAIAPNGDVGGPTAGDPNWSWWAPLR